MGGENRDTTTSVESSAGSSPRGRGKQRGVFHRVFGLRLIPAWAGKTCPRCRPRRRSGAHPRVGGENSLDGLVVDLATGSSPRGRGKPEDQIPDQIPWRLIPAWAGKTLSHLARSPRSAAHPRVGGENLMNPWMRFLPAGSSPRGRGKRCTCHTPRLPRGLIPAWAGKTARRRRADLRSPAHPRVGGENDEDAPGGVGEAGSSPRGRGKHY